MTTRKELNITDSNGDAAKFTKSEITGNGYVSVNSGDCVRILPHQLQEVAEFFSEPAAEIGRFFLIRQRKDNPLKFKIMFANHAEVKLFTSRAMADAHQVRMTEQHGHKFNFFVVKEAK